MTFYAKPGMQAQAFMKEATTAGQKAWPSPIAAHPSRGHYYLKLISPHRKFYTLAALKPYKWYWRLEPDVSFSCSITYDPFAAMARARKVYGWAIALWEEPNTCPSLFRAVSDFKESHRLETTRLWTAMAQASWLPYPFRRWMGKWHRPLHDRFGDAWSLCHYWSNFEIADLDFFRGQEYQELFAYLDAKGGFYNERVGYRTKRRECLASRC